ncbi:unnamed protein product [Ectocarpus sp. CCAP 1310/34]|nr:unnamed protein product [Ectocarpus sp. CCAP 1310/34]
MCMPVFGPQVLMGRDAGPISRLTRTGKGGCSWDGTIMPRKRRYAGTGQLGKAE